MIGAYGDRFAKPPHIDRLAARGLLFENAYCNQAVCAASRTTIATDLRALFAHHLEIRTPFRQ